MALFHKHLDQASKRFKDHSNVAAMYTSLPKDKAERREQTPNQDHLPELRDFAYDQHDSVNHTRGFIADFADFGFRSQHRRVNNGDLLSKAGILGYEKQKPLQDPPAHLKAQFPGFFDMDYSPSRCPGCPTSDTTTTVTTNSVSSNLSNTIDTSTIATSATTESREEENNNRRRRGIRDDPLLLAVAVCILESMRR
ncbi:MAG: hypothetical protein Q9161_001658 [Pseudevernia consocians]